MFVANKIKRPPIWLKHSPNDSNELFYGALVKTQLLRAVCGERRFTST
jgi:hypothetical protein